MNHHEYHGKLSIQAEHPHSPSKLLRHDPLVKEPNEQTKTAKSAPRLCLVLSTAAG
jgi:hypothetical protein